MGGRYDRGCCVPPRPPRSLGASPRRSRGRARTWRWCHLAGTGLSTNYDFAHLVLRDGGWPVSAKTPRCGPSGSAPRSRPLRGGSRQPAQQRPRLWGSGLGSYSSVVTAAYDVARNLENPGYWYNILRDRPGPSAVDGAEHLRRARSGAPAGPQGTTASAPTGAPRRSRRCPRHPAPGAARRPARSRIPQASWARAGAGLHDEERRQLERGVAAGDQRQATGLPRAVPRRRTRRPARRRSPQAPTTSRRSCRRRSTTPSSPTR